MSGGRLCPRCSTLIESSSAIFCYNCGQELGKTSLTARGSLPATVSSGASESKKKSAAFSFLIFLCLSLLVILVLSYFYLERSRIPRRLVAPSSHEFVSTLAALPLAPVFFGKPQFADLAPADADLYLEGASLKNFLSSFLSLEARRQIEVRTSLTLEELTSFFDSPFAFVRIFSNESTASALLAVSRDPEFVGRRVAKLAAEKNLGELKTISLGSYFIVSDSSDLIREISRTYEKTSLALSMTAAYLEALKKLPDQGQLLIYGRSARSLNPALHIFFGQALDEPAQSLGSRALVVGSSSGSTVLKGIHE